MTKPDKWVTFLESAACGNFHYLVRLSVSVRFLGCVCFNLFKRKRYGSFVFITEK